MNAPKKTLAIVAGAATMALASFALAPQAAFAQKKVDKTAAAIADLADRLAVEDAILAYYNQIGTDDHDYSKFFVPEGRLLVNGREAVGHAAIKAMYDAASGGANAGAEGNPARARGTRTPAGRPNMMTSNVRVKVTGDTALVTLNFFSMRSQRLTFPPAVSEYGRERTEYVRRNGAWLITTRSVLTDGGMPESLLDSYKPW
jgi:hypothetical protein